MKCFSISLSIIFIYFIGTETEAQRIVSQDSNQVYLISKPKCWPAELSASLGDKLTSRERFLFPPCP